MKYFTYNLNEFSDVEPEEVGGSAQLIRFLFVQLSDTLAPFVDRFQTLRARIT